MSEDERETRQAEETPAVTVDGIEVHRTAADMDDYELVEALADVMSGDGTLNPAAAVSSLVTYCRCVLGPDYGAVKRALRAKNNGRLTNAAMAEFCNKVMEALGAKN